MIYGGIDVAKHRHEVCLVNDAGDVVLQMHIDNSKRGLNKLLHALERLGIEPDGVKFCLEALDITGSLFFCHLSELGFQLHVINPIQSDALRNLYVRKAKTDQKDALLLADLLRLGRAPATRLPSETILKLQTLSRLRFEFVRQVGGLKNKVLGILDRIFPEYPGCFSDVFIRTSRELLKSYPEPEDLAEVDLSELSAFLKEHSRGRSVRRGLKKFSLWLKAPSALPWLWMLSLSSYALLRANRVH